MLLLTVRLWWRPGSSECEEKKSRNTATVWVCVKDGLVDGELSGQKKTKKKRGGEFLSVSGDKQDPAVAPQATTPSRERPRLLL